MFNFKRLALLTSATLASIVFNGCSKDSSSSTNVLICNDDQCTNAEDYCCAGIGTSKCMLKSDVANDASLTCGVTSGVSFPSGAWTNIGNATDWSKQFQRADDDGDGVLNATEFNNHFSTMTEYNTTTFENTSDPRECCPGHGITNGTMTIGGGKLVYNGVEIQNDECFDGSKISLYTC